VRNVVPSIGNTHILSENDCLKVFVNSGTMFGWEKIVEELVFGTNNISRM
jgi:hypothetical protein